MKRIYYKSDFTLRLQWTRCDHVPLNLEGVDWSAKFFTSSTVNAFEASCIGGKYVNCRRNEDGSLTVVFDRHRLSPGKLEMELHVRVPDPDFADGIRDIRDRKELGMTLTPCQGDCPTTAEIEIIAPFIKGDKGDTGAQGPEGDKGDDFTYDDFTPQQIADLQKPATEAAQQLQEFQATAEANETERQENEAARAEEFATWEDELDSKADRSELSNVLAEEPLTPDNFPDIGTYTREDLKKDLFDDMFRTAAGIYGDIDHSHIEDGVCKPYYLNKIWLTYQEAVASYINRQQPPYNVIASSYTGIHKLLKTNLWCRSVVGAVDNDIDVRGMFSDTWRFAEVLNIECGNYCVRINGLDTFTRCYALKEIIGIFALKKNAANSFQGCNSLETFKMLIIGSFMLSAFNFSDCPNIKLESFQWMVEHATNVINVTVTVHPDVYAKLTDGTNTEWHALLALAAEKNISFATN